MSSEVKILIVEDEGIEALDLQCRLKSLGYTAKDIVATGEEAVRKAEELRPDLVLMDIMLQGEIDGITAAERIHARADIPIIFLTAYADEETLQRAKLTEPYGYLIKPFKEKELHIAVDMALYKHQMERKLRDSEQWLATTLNSIGDAVVATDSNGLITLINPVAEGLMGWKLEEVRNRRLAEVFNLIDSGTRRRVEDPVAKVISEGRVIDLVNHTLLINSNGLEIPIDDSAAPIKDDRGKVIGVVLVFRDITERKCKEQELANYRDHLEKLVAERTADLNLANAQLLHVEKLAAIGRLSASIAHEFNNPLYGIQSVIEGIKKNATMDEDHLQLTDLALAECRRVKILIKSLQEFNRPSSGKKELTDLHLLLDDLLVMIKKDFKNAGVVIKKRYAAELPKVEVVVDQLKQVFLNLLTNAKDAMDGGGAVIIATEDHGRQVAVQIKDTGNGITAADLPRIFEPFFSTKPTVKGTGLGLSISYGIIKGHGGEITVDTEPGRGTTFTVILPLPGTTDDKSENTFS
jgi:PAS domain S-box-containing protein